MTSSRTVPAPLVAASAVLAVLAAGVVALSRFGTVLVHQCVAAEGTVGALGLRLALLRQDAACPSGSLAVGGDSRQVIGVLVLVALPVLVAHLVAAAAALGLLARVRSGVRTAVRALTGLVLRPEPVRPVPARPSRPVLARLVVVPADGPTLGSPLRRGPPARLA